MALLRMNWQTKLGLLRISGRRTVMWLPSQLEQYRCGVQLPKTLQIIDDVGCRAGCKNCVFSTFYQRQDHLSLSDINRLLDEALEMNTTHIYMMGADPFYRENVDEFLDILAQHRYQMFYLFTEGKRLDEKHLERIRQAGNIVIVVNIDGLEESTDRRKGPGSFSTVDRLLGELKNKGIVFGASCMVSKRNFDEVTSKKFVQYLDQLGAFFLAYSPYTPVDIKKENDLVIDERDREKLFNRSLELNKIARRLVVFDLLGIEEKLTECPAARYTMTVHHDGTVTPCLAVPAGLKESNIKKQPLKEIFLNDPLYNAIRNRHRETQRRNRKNGTNDRTQCLFFAEKRFLKDYFTEHSDETTLLAPYFTEWLQMETGDSKS